MSDRTYYIASASIITVAIASAAWLTREGGRAIVGPDEAHKSLGRLVPGQAVEVPFRIHNGSSRPLRIVGATSTCNLEGCFGPNIDLVFPLTVPPRSDWLLKATYKATSPGSFSHPMTVFTDSEQAPKIALSVSGQIVAPRDAGGS
jgi:Protein of unknown function (DUF1573)